MALAGRQRVGVRTSSGSHSTGDWREMRRAFQAINQEKEFGDMVYAALRQACRLFRSEGALLLLANRGTGLLEIAAVENISAEALEHYRRAPARTGALGPDLPPAEAAREQERLRALGQGFAAHQLVPITLRKKILGALMLAAAQPGEEPPARPEALDVFLEFLAGAIENAYLIFQYRQQNDHLALMMTRLQNAQNHLKRAENLALVGKFAAGVAHEVRNPLTVVGTTLQLVYEKLEAGNPERALYATMIEKLGEVDRTIREMLTLARPAPLRPGAVDLKAGVAKVMTFLQRKLASRSLALDLDLPEDLPRAWADEEHWQRILINLFLNAIAFLPAGGRIRLQGRAAEKSPWIEILFSDNGPGIPAEAAEKIFEPFFSTRHDGTGLGLFLLRHWLEEMNGSIELVSASGAGAAFKIRLPRENAAPRVEPLA